MSSETIQSLFDLTGKIALVTGGTNLGYYACEALAELGATVILTRRNQVQAEETAEKLRLTKRTPAMGMALEVTDEANWSEVVSRIVSDVGGIDILINNAGGRKVTQGLSNDIDSLAGFLEKRPLEDWQYTLDANLTSVFIGCKTVIPYMKQRKRGKIINMASIDGVVGRDLRIYEGTGLSATVPDYLASKGGVIQLTKALAVAYAPQGIYVNSLSPGGFFRNQPKAFVDHYERQVPLGRMGRDHIDLKGPIAFLASSASDYMVGHNLIVDGGYTAW